MHFRTSDQEFEKKIAKYHHHKVHFDYFITVEGAIRTISIRNGHENEVVFLHGAPGSSKDYTRYLKDSQLVEQCDLLIIDRPGYGFSNYGQVEPSAKKQAAMVQETINDSSIIIGHSYGGPVAASLAMYYPQKVKELILLAPAIDPYHEKQFIVNRVFCYPPFKWILSPAFRVALEEKLTHEAALVDILEDWGDITCPVTIAHGKKDKIVPDDNVAFLKDKLTNAPLEIIHPEDMSHLMIWDDYDFVKKLIVDRVN